MFLSVKALVVGAFNKEKAIVGAFSRHCEILQVPLPGVADRAHLADT